MNDGMDVVNLSLGSVPAPRVADDEDAQVIESAISLGMMVVIAAGNAGPDPNTIGSPGTAPSAITIGAMNNDRYFAAPFTVGNHAPFPAVPGYEGLPVNPITASLWTSRRISIRRAWRAAPLPAGSLSGKMAFILRGTCTFEIKLNYALQAGAIAALIYTYPSSPMPSPWMSARPRCRLKW